MNINIKNNSTCNVLMLCIKASIYRSKFQNYEVVYNKKYAPFYCFLYTQLLNHKKLQTVYT